MSFPLNGVTARFRLEGRVALVTGPGRCVGRSVAMALAGAGAEVLLMARTRDEIEQAAVVFAVSPAASLMTGTSLVIDGAGLRNKRQSEASEEELNRTSRAGVSSGSRAQSVIGTSRRWTSCRGDTTRSVSI